MILYIIVMFELIEKTLGISLQHVSILRQHRLMELMFKAKGTRLTYMTNIMLALDMPIYGAMSLVGMISLKFVANISCPVRKR